MLNCNQPLSLKWQWTLQISLETKQQQGTTVSPATVALYFWFGPVMLFCSTYLKVRTMILPFVMLAMTEFVWKCKSIPCHHVESKSSFVLWSGLLLKELILLLLLLFLLLLIQLFLLLLILLFQHLLSFLLFVLMLWSSAAYLTAVWFFSNSSTLCLLPFWEYLMRLLLLVVLLLIWPRRK